MKEYTFEVTFSDGDVLVLSNRNYTRRMAIMQIINTEVRDIEKIEFKKHEIK